MQKLKKLFCFILPLVMILSFAACSGDSGDEGNSEKPDDTTSGKEKEKDGYIGSYKGEIISSWDSSYVIITVNNDNTCIFQSYTSNKYAVKSGPSNTITWEQVDKSTIKLIIKQSTTLTCVTSDNWKTLEVSGMYTGTLTRITDELPVEKDAGSITVTTANIATAISNAINAGNTKITLVVTDVTNDTLSTINSALNDNSDSISIKLDLSQSTDLTEISFAYCTNLISIIIPNSVKTIKKNAFNHCESLENLTLPEGLEKIGDSAFRQCQALSSITIPKTVTCIDSNAFAYCGRLESVILYEGLQEINHEAFENCSSLKNIVIPSSITELDNYSFVGCTNLQSITIDSKCTTYKSIDGVVYSADGSTLYIYPKGKKETSFSIPDGVTKISSDAFIECKTLENIIIPASVIEINNAFYKCKNLKNITVATGNTAYKSIDGVLYSSNGTILYIYPSAKDDTSFSIPENVIIIYDRAFNYNAKIESISIPNTVTSIGTSCFKDCTSLMKIQIDTISQWCKILFQNSTDNPLSNGAALYINGKEVENLIIPDGVTEIPFAAFYGCTSIKNIKLSDSIITIGKSAFNKCVNLESVTIGKNVVTIAGYAFKDCSSLTNVVFSDTESVWYSTGNSNYKNGKEIGAMSATATAENANKLKTTYCSYYLYNSKYNSH